MSTHSLSTPDDRTATIVEHYRRLAGQYDAFLYYSPEFVRTLTSKMIEALDLRKTDRFVDLGCGTAMYSLDIVKQVPLDSPIVGVDPIGEMLERIPGGAPVTPVALGALEFSARPGTYDKILMKEAVHHEPDRATLFANLFERLSPSGRLLLVHVPPTLSYPLFDKALRRAEQWHADPDELVARLGDAGFEVRRDAVDYPHAIPTKTYFKMVANQYMSVLSSFPQEDIAEGLAEMEQKYGSRPTLEFTDHFDYITGIRPA
jgi:SAM-dependent methyltransferase